MKPNKEFIKQLTIAEAKRFQLRNDIDYYSYWDLWRDHEANWYGHLHLTVKIARELEQLCDRKDEA